VASHAHGNDASGAPGPHGAQGDHADAGGRMSFVTRTCLPFLEDSQNQDGGWSFQPDRQSRVEPSAWALLALQEFPSSSRAPTHHALDHHVLDKGLKFLADAQLENGGWAAVSGDQDREGCWVTSLACWALGSEKKYASNLARGLRWLADDRPGDSGFWWRTARKLTDRKRVNAQSASLSGWSWTPHTASWVEPTSYAMIVEQRESSVSLSGVNRRYKIAEEMLYDRMCPGGGWNCGNPKVYGVAGEPQVGPTVWALIALRENSQRLENQQSLAWLANTQDAIKSPESLALAQIALSVYGRSNPALAGNLRNLHGSAVLPWSVEAIAWTALGFSETSRWLSAKSNGNSDAC
jgi:hypothetical protein